MTTLLELGVIFNILDDVNWTFMWVACILPLTVSRLRHLQHSLFIEVLSCRFRVIKMELKSIARLSKLESNQLIAKNYAFYDGLFNKISSIKKVYNILWETSLLINKSFGISQLTNLLQNFVQLTCDLYMMYSFLYYNDFDKIPGNYQIFNFISCINHLFYKIFSPETINRTRISNMSYTNHCHNGVESMRSVLGRSSLHWILAS